LLVGGGFNCNAIPAYDIAEVRLDLAVASRSGFKFYQDLPASMRDYDAMLMLVASRNLVLGGLDAILLSLAKPALCHMPGVLIELGDRALAIAPNLMGRRQRLFRGD
jgi:hypothetical protein